MTEKVEIKHSSPEEVALRLTETVALSESLKAVSQDSEFRKKYLDLYAECLVATTGYRQ